MWIASKFGWFSIVNKGGKFHVRARVRRDLENLKAAAGLRHQKIIETPNADYRFRLCVIQPSVSRIFKALEASIDYPNFKSEIGMRADQMAKLSSYHRIWEEMMSHQIGPFADCRKIKIESTPHEPDEPRPFWDALNERFMDEAAGDAR